MGGDTSKLASQREVDEHFFGSNQTAAAAAAAAAVYDKYVHKELVKKDIIAVVRRFAQLRVSRGEFYEPSGICRDLLKLQGTIPVQYRGSMYNIPVCLWLDHQHPYRAPICMVESTNNVYVRRVKNVDSDGMVNLAYLHGWIPLNSDILGLIQAMQYQFGRECPVYSRSASTHAAGVAAGRPAPQPNSITAHPSTGPPRSPPPECPARASHPADSAAAAAQETSCPGSQPYPSEPPPPYPGPSSSNTTSGSLLGAEGSSSEDTRRRRLQATMDEATEYTYKRLVMKDLIAVTKKFAELRAKRSQFKQSNGQRCYLVKLYGTIPVRYKGNVYNIPVCLWLDHQHPHRAPICMVEPKQNMQVKTGKNIDSKGMVNLPYLRDWIFPNSDILNLIQVMQLQFEEECPVYSRPAGEPAAAAVAAVAGNSTDRRSSLSQPSCTPLANSRSSSTAQAAIQSSSSSQVSTPKRRAKEDAQTQLAALTARVSALKVERTELTSRVQVLTSRVDVVEDEKADLASLVAALERKNTTLERRSSVLERKSSALESKNAELERKSSALESRNAELERKNTSLESKSSELESANTMLKNRASEMRQAASVLSSYAHDPDYDTCHSVGLVPSARHQQYAVTTVTASGSQQDDPGTAAAQLGISRQEYRLREECRDNIVIHNLPEHSGEDLHDICAGLFRIDADLIQSAARLGRPRQEPKSASGRKAAAARLVRVQFYNQDVKAAVYKMRNIKHRGTAVRLTHDMTPKQLSTRKLYTDQFHALRKIGVRCSLPFDRILDANGKPLSDSAIQELLPNDTLYVA
ncbi:uncharacterized protein LOC135819285 isoform X1 [Sycon ciliatum]|uniref:uncharacterized protein LOC135819285 isoform X1 n=1 Tax=Sycon ciliatum TaxID=27933 RepID=UPI0031F5F2B2